MNNELINILLVEKYRPKDIKDLISSSKNEIEDFLKYPLKMPSLLLYSSSPGTGKTSLAKLISLKLNCDVLTLNASKERGIDKIREQVNTFAEHMSSTATSKKMIFMDEADFLTAQAQGSLRNMIEEYSNNVFFVFTCNDISKIIEPIRSRCRIISFENPPKNQILDRLEDICKLEKITYDIEVLAKLIDLYYPDIRSMIKCLENASIDKRTMFLGDNIIFERFFDALKNFDVKYIYDNTYNTSMSLLAFNKWLFKFLMKNYSSFSKDEIRKIAMLIADTEKAWNLGVNLSIIFLANMFEIAQILSLKKTK
jgi:replication factor C small subunit